MTCPSPLLRYLLRQLHPKLPAAAHLGGTADPQKPPTWNAQQREYAGVRAICLGRITPGRAATGLKRRATVAGLGVGPSVAAAAAGLKCRAIGHCTPAAYDPSGTASAVLPAGVPAPARGASDREVVQRGPLRVTLRRLQPLLAAALGLEAGAFGSADGGAAEEGEVSEPEEGELPPRAPSQLELRALIQSIATLRCVPYRVIFWLTTQSLTLE